MAYRIKNWDKFQHYNNKRNKQAKFPWIKLYHDLLDDMEWFNLSGDASKLLVMCWLIASELDGALPDLKILSFRLRISESKLNASLSTLSHWVYQDASDLLADCKQPAMRDREEIEKRGEEKEKEYPFLTIWGKYPNKDGKKQAEAHFKASVKTDQDWSDINRALTNYLGSPSVLKGFIKNGSTWFNNWRDWIDYKGDQNAKPRITSDLDRLLDKEVRKDNAGKGLGSVPGMFGGVDET